jgi:S-DNA-T family DNA segregation ATPase FtsK/SpoIIIE
VARGAAREHAEAGRRLLREVEGIIGAVAALFLIASFLSYDPDNVGRNLCGPVGHAVADVLVPALGLATYLIPLYLSVLAWQLLREDGPAIPIGKAIGCGVLVLAIATALALVRDSVSGTDAGGWLGGFIAIELRAFLGTFGAVIVTGALLGFSLQLSTEASLPAVARSVRSGGTTLATAMLARARMWQEALRERRAAKEKAKPPPVIQPDKPAKGREPLVLTAPVVRVPPPEGGRRDKGSARRRDRAAATATASTAQTELPFRAHGKYKLPTVALLDPPLQSVVKVDEEALIASSRILESKLRDFGVDGRVVAVQPGPVITTFEFEPAPGVKVNRIITLADDLSMALRALSVRILAPIPGKPVVGIEVSNPRRDKVFIRELFETDAFSSSRSHLALGLGKDPTGQPFVTDLARMPHVLVAGATGTGKSVSINAMLLSMLFRSTPHDVRFIMIDPKMLELSIYEEIPHLLVPVVTDPKKASAALNNVIREMQYRYRLLHAKGVRGLDSYNRLIDRESEEREDERDDGADEAENGDVIELHDAVEDDPADRPPPARPDDEPLVHQHLPHIVIVIDEFADLMMTAGRDIETAVTRLAQKARAAGIHIILATQRPSVDVITGLIKANFPARLSFQVTSRPDSRTILDCIGAERLLGEGDMLFMPPGTARVQRLHGAFVSDDEVRRVVDFVKQQGKPEYRMELLAAEDEQPTGSDEEPYDEMYDEAVRVVTESGQASISWVQRRLRVGYNRAARMVERMEQEGVVSASEGGRPREVLARRIDGIDG